ncbi:hypothetical protein PHYBOEH_010381 [Phytophthora boehmeriae]|uniref:non-specific serine/threonine protein kinase n=1 Tax=Phytophthora boehmeriae TaxID=109152 RepID=A0A8T1VRX3_9STRA|nr:hypothetical protein PHYBOEH_010381 [Phytophthora boehmeriae]
MRRTRLRPRELTALWLLSTVLATPSAARRSETAASCQYPPSLNTLRQSTKDTSDAEVVYTNCSVVKLVSSASNGTTSLDASNLNIQSVSSFPDVTTVVLSGNAITTIEDDPDATVKTLDLSSNGLSGLYDLSIPSSVNRLVLDGNAIAALDDGELASSVTTLSLKKNGITSLSSFEFSESLVGLDASENTLYDLSKWQMPSQLQVFTCRECEVSSLSGISFPSSGSLTTFDLTGSTVESFEIANSTVALLENLGWLQLTVSSTTCSEPSAKKNDFQSATVCVLPDALFNSKYVIDSSETSETAPTPPPPVPVNGSAPVVTIPPPVETASASWMMVAMISGAALMLMLIGGAVGYLVFRHRRTNKYDEYTEDGRSPSFHAVDIIGADAPGNNRTTHISTPSLHTATLQSGALRSATQDTEESSVRRSTRPALSGKHLDNDIRTDQEMRHFRLMHEEVVRGKLIAKGGYGAVYMASFRNKVVVMKQLLPERARDYRMLNNFMDEIRVCASLDHPKIVSFIGFTFSSLMDLSAVMEYMPRGDLSTVMQKQLKRENRDPLARDSYGWFRSTRSDRGGLKCKSLIALDIAEAGA